MPYAKTLYQSIQRFNNNARLQVLVVDAVEGMLDESEYLSYYSLDQLIDTQFFSEIKQKYFRKHRIDRFRWSIKPVFVNYLFQLDFDKVIIVDSDVHFFNDFEFLFDDLNEYNIILSPHWRTLDPSFDEGDFSRNYTNGLYNGGFVGFNKKSQNAVLWWAKVCSYKCEINPKKGFYDDQGYLTLLPLIEEKVKIIHHRGCNVASWNNIENKRNEIDDEVFINGKYPIIFIHFSNKIFERAAKGIDTTLKKYIIDYSKSLASNGAMLNKYQKQLIKDYDKDN
ncbi:MAG: hypothetical protein KI791_19680 [Cyclobacteriaceae bacterium]|nr:hypothetical protein [Cyclobacteriaceae bacterium SS2]